MSLTKTQELAKLINAEFGKDTVRMGSDPYFEVTYLPTGIAPVDDLLQGGIPFGRFVEIFGDYSTLKSYVGLCAIRECQRMGKLAALIDTEHAFDPEWAANIGVNTEDLIIKHPETGEAAIDVSEVLIRSGVDLIVFDSVAAALPKAEQKLKLDSDKNVQPARLAQLMSLAMRKLTAANGKTGMLWINQTRVNVGVMFGSNESVPGGKALPYYASYRIAFRKAGSVKEDIQIWSTDSDGRPKKKASKQTVAQIIRATVEKSKLNAPFREVVFHFDFRNGEVDDWLYLAYKALDEGVLTLDRGRWWVTKNPSKKFRGVEETREGITENQLRKMLGMQTLSDSPGKQGSVAKKMAAGQSDASSKRVVRVNTRGRAQVASKKTVTIRKRSTK